MLVKFLRVIEGKDFSNKNLEEILNALYTFAPMTDDHLKESMELVISGNFKNLEKSRILEFILKRTKSLPDEILAFQYRKRTNSTFKKFSSIQKPHYLL